METLSLVLWLALSVLLSAVIDRFVPRVSLPLIQIVMGAVIAVFAGNMIDVDLDPDLFLVLFIAPLLYIEAKDADKALLWRNKKPIISLAIGLVVVSTLIIGFAVHLLIPSISLAAAFALGAALGPTDAVAVTSLSKQVSLPERQWGILKGELLLNDASGIVSFQFAIAAATTGAFSLIEAGEAFIIEFVGGLLFGLIVGYGANLLIRKIRDLGIDEVNFHIMFEICIPFIVYLSATALHVSGIIAVVVAGLVNVIAPRTSSPSIAHMNIVSTHVWQVIAFILNGIVFVMLGTQIPTAMYYTWQNPSISNEALVGYVLFVTAVLMAVRFVWCIFVELVHVKCGRKEHFGKQEVRNAAILTFCGSKGTITLSILFTIPFYIQTGQAFPARSLILFIGCGVILMTLLIANFIVPLVSPKKKRKKTEIEERQSFYETLSDILRNVIEELTAQQKPTNRRATAAVIKIYQDRLQNTKDAIDVGTETDLSLRAEIIGYEKIRTRVMIDEGLVSHDVGFDYLARLDRMQKLISHRDERSPLNRFFDRIRLALVRARLFIVRRFINPNMLSERQDEMRKLQIDTANYVIEILKKMIHDDNVQTEEASKILIAYERTLSVLKMSTTSLTRSLKVADESDDIRRTAYQIELEQIQKMYEQDRITRQQANRMRDNVYMMQMDLEDKI